jgi:hypothetical protein
MSGPNMGFSSLSLLEKSDLFIAGGVDGYVYM